MNYYVYKNNKIGFQEFFYQTFNTEKCIYQMLKDIKYTVNSETIATDVFRKMLLSSQFQNSFNKYKLLLGYKRKCFIFLFYYIRIVNYFWTTTTTTTRRKKPT